MAVHLLVSLRCPFSATGTTSTSTSNNVFHRRSERSVFMCLIVVLFAIVGNIGGSAIARDGDVNSNNQRDYELEIRMPNVVSYKPDALMCTGVQLEPDEAYIVKFTPHASKKTAHHMMVYGCEQAARNISSWECYRSELEQSENSVCAPGVERQILFAWALDAPAKSLPEGVGFRVAGTTHIKHIVIQLHYARTFEEGETDQSGVTLSLSYNRPPQQMGYYVLVSTGFVQPRKQENHLEMACEYTGDNPIYPIGYRTHSHNLGVVTAGYRIRDGNWTEIGRMSPQLPQTFYEVTNPGMDIRKGDILAARCTMNSLSRGDITLMGASNHDEMCNFYIMYSTHEQQNLHNSFCAESSTWKDVIPQLLPGPANASSLVGIPHADQVMKKFNMTSSSLV